jgi:hypothetical protein
MRANNFIFFIKQAQFMIFCMSSEHCGHFLLIINVYFSQTTTVFSDLDSPVCMLSQFSSFHALTIITQTYFQSSKTVKSSFIYVARCSTFLQPCYIPTLIISIVYTVCHEQLNISRVTQPLPYKKMRSV